MVCRRVSPYIELGVSKVKAIKFSEAEYVALVHLFSGGDISSSSKVELERFAVMLSRPNAYAHFGGSSFPQICETVRTLLIVRMSEEQNVEASRISRVAMFVALVALIVTAIQTIATIWPLLPKRETPSEVPVVAPTAQPLKNNSAPSVTTK